MSGAHGDKASLVRYTPDIGLMRDEGNAPGDFKCSRQHRALSRESGAGDGDETPCTRQEWGDRPR